jgi:hypothetical protein
MADSQNLYRELGLNRYKIREGDLFELCTVVINWIYVISDQIYRKKKREKEVFRRSDQIKNPIRNFF